jgi:uncharacterized protein YukE
VGSLTPADVKRWDLNAIRAVFETASGRANTLQRLGESLQQAHSVLADWQGEAGDAFRVDVGKIRRDIEADGAESKQVAAAVARAEADVAACKRDLDHIEQVAQANGWSITPDWRIDPGPKGIPQNRVDLANQLQILQGDLSACKLHAHAADHELATAIGAAVGAVPLDAGGSAPGAPAPQGPPDSPPGGKPKTLQDMMIPGGAPDAPPGGTPPKDPSVPGGKPKTWQDLVLPPGAADAPPGGTPPKDAPAPAAVAPGGTPPKGPLAPTAGGKPRTLRDMLLPEGAVPLPQPSPAELENAKALLRKVMIGDGVPPDQIEARVNEMVAGAQRWIDQGGIPPYLPPEPKPGPTPGFGEGFADRWFATEESAHNLLGVGNRGLPGALDAWKQLVQGTVETAQNPLGAAVGEVKNALDSPSPAYFLGGKTADAAVSLPAMLFGPEGAGISRAAELADLDAAGGLPHEMPGVPPPTGTGEHLPAGIGDHHSPAPIDHPIPDGHHSLDPYPVDSAGHYIPGSLPSYEQLREITSTAPNSAYYWSGRTADGIGVGPDDSGIAELIAQGSGGKTLEMTLAERGVDPLPVWNRHDPVSVKFWEDASAAYAEGANGEVTAIIGSNLRPGNLWQSVEIPRLMENPGISRIVQIDPDTGRSVTIFERGK